MTHYTNDVELIVQSGTRCVFVMKEWQTWWGSVYVKLRTVNGEIKVEFEWHDFRVCLQEVKTMSSSSVVCVSDSTPSTLDPYLRLQCMCGGDEWVKWGGLSTLRAWSLSSSWATSLPQACAILLPATRLPTIIEAGPTSVQHNHIRPCQTHVSQVRADIYTNIKKKLHSNEKKN